MSHSFVRPQNHTQVDVDCIAVTKAGGLFGMDVEGSNEDLDVEQGKFEGFEGMDAEVPAEPRQKSAEAHDARVTPSFIAKHDATHCPYCSRCAVCVADSAKEDRIQGARSAARRWGCQRSRRIMIFWKTI